MPIKMNLDFSSDYHPRKLIEVLVATAEELLEFANRVREAGGAAPLDALLPSIPEQSEECLIAKSVNFASSVRTHKTVTSGHECVYHDDGSWVWCMVPLATDFKAGDVERIANKLGLEFTETVEFARINGEHKKAEAIILPPEIGNAARAFDLGQAFRELAA